jgi:hypothetical protein
MTKGAARPSTGNGRPVLMMSAPNDGVFHECDCEGGDPRLV